MAFIASPRKALKIVPKRRVEKEKAEKEKANLHGLEKSSRHEENERD
jgi:hypothetical protein